MVTATVGRAPWRVARASIGTLILAAAVATLAAPLVADALGRSPATKLASH